MTRPAPLQQWPPDESEMAQRMRAYDWSATPLGSMAAWPDALTKAVAAAMLSSDAATGHDASPAPLTTDAVNAFLVRFSDAVLHSTDPQAVALTACQLVSDTLGVERAYWAEVDWTTREYVIGAAVHRPGVPVISGRFPVESWEPFTAYHLSGRSVVVDDTQADERISPEMQAAYAQIAVGADLATPIVVNGRLRGTLAVNQQLPRHWNEEEVALVRGIASRCWAAVDRARAETALRTSEARYRALATASSDVIYHMGADWREMRQLDGRGILADTVDPSETWLATYILPEDQPQVAEAIAEAVRTGTPFELDHRVRHADGSIGWTHSRAVPLHDAQGRAVAWVGTATDITAQRQADDRLRQSEARYRALFAAMDEGYCRYQIIAGDDGAPQDALILEANAAYERLMQRPSPVGKRLREVEPHLDQEWLNSLVDVANAGVPRRFERYNPRLDRWFDVQVTPSAGDGIGDEVVLVFSDITERRRATEALRASEERQAFLLQVSDALRPLHDAAAIQATATALLLRHFAAGWCYFVEWNEAAMVGVVLRDATREGLPSLVGVHDVSDVPEFLAFLRSGQALIVPDYATYALLSPRIRTRYTALGFRSMVGVPLVKDGRLVALLLVGDTEPREWSAIDVSIVEEIAERTWAALQRARAETALQASEERYRTLFEAIDDGFTIFELIFDEAGKPVDLRYLVTNEGFGRQMGVRPQPGQTFREFFPEADDFWLAIYAEVARTREPRRIIDHDSGLDRWLDISVFPTEAPPERMQVAVLFRDATTQKRAEASLRASEERQAFLLRLSDALRPLRDPVQIQGEAARILGEHLGLSRVFYAPIEPGANGDDFVIFHEFRKPGASSIVGRFPVAGLGAQLFAEVQAGRTVVAANMNTQSLLSPAELEIYLAFEAHAYVAVPLVKDGRFAALMTVHQDAPRAWTAAEVALIEATAERLWSAVEQARAESALLASEERYRLIVQEATEYAIFSTDTDRRIETWSPGATTAFGWTAEEAIGQRMDMTYTPEDQAEGVPEREFAQARDAGSATNVRWHQRKDGTQVFIDGSSYARRGEDGAFQGTFKVGQDVTARLLADEARRASEARSRENLEAEVAAATVELRALSRRLLLVQEEERRRLALELHDEIGQVLTGLTYQLAAAQGQNVAALAAANSTVQMLAEQVRQMALELRPQVLDRYGLLAAVRWYVERYEATTGITVHLREQDVAQRRYPPEIEIAAFRVVQEALTNIARYAGGNEAWVTLFSDGVLLLVIHDEGHGFDPAAPRASSGLDGMRERVALLGGTFALETAPGEGVQITAEFPLRMRDPAAREVPS